MKRLERRLLAIAVLSCAASTAGAQDFHAQGFLEARLPLADGKDRSWTEGGLGKMRFGDGDQSLQAAGALSLSWQVSDSLLAVADLQAQGQTSPELGVLSAYLRWRPVSTSPWRWTVRAGAFFPPVSLENDGVGWTSRWTLSPSALNSWVGEELRTIGAEARLEHRGVHGSFEFGVALFRWNDPAGELIFSRGWALGDVTSPLGARVRQPDAYSDAFSPVPVEYKPFVENDNRTGWHADAEWRSPRGIRLRALRYDNRAEPDTYSHQAGRDVFSWKTRFGSVGAEVPLGGLVLAAQSLKGSTIIEPAEEFYIESHFRAAFLLAAWDRGAWRPALRYDRFRAHVKPDFIGDELEEEGHAWTAALNWRPRDSLRLTAEWLRVDSTRNQRLLAGLAPRQREDLLQIMLRYQF
jgi:hypothetical protein